MLNITNNRIEKYVDITKYQSAKVFADNRHYKIIKKILAGTAILVGSDKFKIVSEALKLLENQSYYSSIASSSNPYGDGTASERICTFIDQLT